MKGKSVAGLVGFACKPCALNMQRKYGTFYSSRRIEKPNGSRSMNDIGVLILKDWKGPIMLVMLAVTCIFPYVYMLYIRKHSFSSSAEKIKKTIGPFIITTLFICYFLYDSIFTISYFFMTSFPDMSIVTLFIFFALIFFLLYFQYEIYNIMMLVPKSQHIIRSLLIMIPIVIFIFPAFIFAIYELLKWNAFIFYDYVNVIAFDFIVICIYSIFWSIYFKKSKKIKVLGKQ